MPVGGNHGKKPPAPQYQPKAHGRKPSAPPPHKSSGKGACEMWVPVAVGMTLFYALPRLAYDSWRARRGH